MAHRRPDPARGSLAARELGHRAPARELRGQMPPKERGRHRWIAIATHTLTADAAARAHRADEEVILDLETLIYLGVGCVDCEQPFPPDVDPCPAGDEWGGSS